MGDKGNNAILRAASSLITFWIIFGTSLLIAGICCMCLQDQMICTTKSKYVYDDQKQVTEYTDCENTHSKKCNDPNKTDNGPCVCPIDITIDKDINGEVVVLYQLDNFNTSIVAKQPNFFQSRDDNQLRGVLTDAPAATCRPYERDELNRTIAPCGALADAMFNDSIILRNNGIPVPRLYDGLLTDYQKQGYRNPPSNNLTVAFQNFSKPMHWLKNIWELNPSDPNNNAFQNEEFIAWMTPEMGLKPQWRLDRSNETYKDGLPNGEYRLYIYYNYPVSLYNGPRKVVIAVRNIDTSETCKKIHSTVLFDVGISGIVIGAIFLLLAAGLTFYEKIKARSPAKCEPTNSGGGDRHSREPKPSVEPVKQNLIHSDLIKTDEIPNATTEVTPALKNKEPQQKLLENKEEKQEIVDDINDYL